MLLSKINKQTCSTIRIYLSFVIYTILLDCQKIKSIVKSDLRLNQTSENRAKQGRTKIVK